MIINYFIEKENKVVEGSHEAELVFGEPVAFIMGLAWTACFGIKNRYSCQEGIQAEDGGLLQMVDSRDTIYTGGIVTLSEELG